MSETPKHREYRTVSENSASQWLLRESEFTALEHSRASEKGKDTDYWTRRGEVIKEIQSSLQTDPEIEEALQALILQGIVEPFARDAKHERRPEETARIIVKYLDSLPSDQGK